MIKNIVTSMITTVIVIVFVLIGLDVFVNNEAKTQIENISYEDNKERKVEFVYEENNSVVSTSSVVGIAVKKNSGNKIAQVLDSTWSVGSGCILDSKGYIITNQHVIGNEKDDIFVTLYGGDSIKGELIWSSNLLDLAVIKINIGGLPSAVMGDSDSLRIGERAIAIGNPLGFDFQGTLTSGVISGLNRTVEVNGIYMEDLIQTDASINSGNSGGPLMNSKGEVIGINTVKVASAEGIGFAIPINQIKPIIDKIVKNGEFIEPYFGVLAYDKAMTSYISSDIKLDTGIFVYDIEYGSPAYVSGIRKGNIILTVDDIPIDTLCEFRSILFSKNIGEKMRVKILNDKGEKEVVIQVKSRK